MIKNVPLPNNSQNLQNYCIINACYRYFSETIRDRNLELLPMYPVH